jgi:hypothetical protein
MRCFLTKGEEVQVNRFRKGKQGIQGSKKEATY